MLTAEILEIGGFKPAIHGMRNPKNSWDRSDSVFFDEDDFDIGENDFKLMKNLFKAGTEHRKYDRMITVYIDINAPLYWWKEFDTYKVGTVANSCSTMHKIHAKRFEPIDFSWEHIDRDVFGGVCNDILAGLNVAREDYLNAVENKDKDLAKHYWWQMIQLLPSAYNQKRTVMLNYEVCTRIIEQRKNHKLDEWHQLIDVLKTLPYLNELMDNG